MRIGILSDIHSNLEALTETLAALDRLRPDRVLCLGDVAEVVATRFGLRRGYKYVISVGSVGQPRDCDNRACFVLYDSDQRIVEYHRVPYDIETSAQKIFDADLALNFGKRLFLGV